MGRLVLTWHEGGVLKKKLIKQAGSFEAFAETVLAHTGLREFRVLLGSSSGAEVDREDYELIESNDTVYVEDAESSKSPQSDADSASEVEIQSPRRGTRVVAPRVALLARSERETREKTPEVLLSVPRAQSNRQAFIFGIYWLSHSENVTQFVERNALTSLTQQQHFVRKIIGGKRSVNNVSALTELREIPEAMGAAVVTCGASSSAFVLPDGTVHMEGSEKLHHHCLETPSQSTVIDMSSGAYCSAALTSEGRVLSWGLNSNFNTTGVKGNEIKERVQRHEFIPGGQLGRSINGVSSGPGLIHELHACVAVSCGSTHCIAVTEAGLMWGWGSNDEGQLMEGSSSALQPVNLPLPEAVSRVSCGDHHSVALTKEGRVYVWGWNRHGQLGVDLNAEHGHDIAHSPVLLKNLPDNVSMISAGQSHTLAVVHTEGRIYSWGRNRFGELGRGGSFHPRPIDQVFPAPISVSARGYVNVAVTGDGLLYRWGFLGGRLGLTHQLSPAVIDVGNNYVAQASAGLTHFAFINEPTLTMFTELIKRNDFAERDVVKLLSDVPDGSAFTGLQNRLHPQLQLSSAYVVVNTQLTSVSFNQVRVTNTGEAALTVEVSQGRNLPADVELAVEPLSFRLPAGASKMMNITCTAIVPVEETWYSYFSLTVRQGRRRFRHLRRRGGRDANAAGEQELPFLVAITFPFSPSRAQFEGLNSMFFSRYAAQNDLTRLKAIVQRSENPSVTINQSDYEGNTALFIASKRGHVDLVRWLLLANADVNKSSGAGETPLAAANAAGHKEVVELLLGHGGLLDIEASVAPTDEELQFLRAANLLYIGARAQDLSALDQQELILLQTSLLRRMQDLSVAPPLEYFLEPSESEGTHGGHTEESEPAVAEVAMEKEFPEQLTERWRQVLDSSDNIQICGRRWEFFGVREGAWETEFTKAKCALISAPGCARVVFHWTQGIAFSRGDSDFVVLLWAAAEDNHFNLLCWSQPGAMRELAEEVVEDLLLGERFSDPAAAPPSQDRAWFAHVHSFYFCPACIAADSTSFDLQSWINVEEFRSDRIELATVVKQQSVTCDNDHRVSLALLSPELMLPEISERYHLDELSEQLRVGKRMAAGGFSHVFLGQFFDPAAEQPIEVAIKEYIQRKPIIFGFDSPEEKAAKEEEINKGALVVRKRLRSEVRMLAQFETEPRILGFLGFSWSPSYVVTPYYVLGDVYRLLHNEFSFPELDFMWRIGALIDVARGLAYMHKHRVLHRDLKCPNIYILSMDPNDSQRVVVGDLGTLAPLYGEYRSDIVPVTNPVWMAPELILQKPYNEGVDVYAFAISLWEVLTRAFPFSHVASEAELKLRIPEGVRPLIPEQAEPHEVMLYDLAQECWAGDPEKRPRFPQLVERLRVIKNQIVSTSATNK